eukprot:TRINITY_DN771_c0_g2_i8.p1 TRINITY_DN771_c0_g2~~TRINITY_DN771_c0_g2_i8.p1  ORF type:complete len:131 (+),score=43.01 TRINITY_DN771_c0_g2_i8:127-519(+)
MMGARILLGFAMALATAYSCTTEVWQAGGVKKCVDPCNYSNVIWDRHGNAMCLQYQLTTGGQQICPWSNIAYDAYGTPLCMVSQNNQELCKTSSIAYDHAHQPVCVSTSDGFSCPAERIKYNGSLDPYCS